MIPKTTLALILASISFGLFGQFALKLGAARLTTPAFAGLPWVLRFIRDVAFNPFIVAGLFAYALGAFLWILVLRKTDLSLAYPYLALNFVAVLVFSALFLREHISLPRMGGAALIAMGLLLTSRG